MAARMAILRRPTERYHEPTIKEKQQALTAEGSYRIETHIKVIFIIACNNFGMEANCSRK